MPDPTPRPGTGATGWPPPATDLTSWRLVLATHPGETRPLRTRVRAVRLWGQRVWIDQTDRVWCPGCLELLDPADLSRPDNSHPIGLPATTGALIPDTTPAPAAPSDPQGW